jgi:selenocysteine-specific translation elongation factor
MLVLVAANNKHTKQVDRGVVLATTQQLVVAAVVCVDKVLVLVAAQAQQYDQRRITVGHASVACMCSLQG